MIRTATPEFRAYLATLTDPGRRYIIAGQCGHEHIGDDLSALYAEVEWCGEGTLMGRNAQRRRGERRMGSDREGTDFTDAERQAVGELAVVIAGEVTKALRLLNGVPVHVGMAAALIVLEEAKQGVLKIGEEAGVSVVSERTGPRGTA